MSTALDTFKSFIETSFTELTKEQKEYDTYKTPEQGAKDEFAAFENEMESSFPSKDKNFIETPEKKSLDIDSVFSNLIQAESRGQQFDKSGKILTSKKGAQGITQVMPKTQKDPGYGVTPAKDKSEAEFLRVGKEYLNAMHERFDGDWEKAVAAYNAGPVNVQKAITKAKELGQDWKEHLPKKSETLPYIDKILGTEYSKKIKKEVDEDRGYGRRPDGTAKGEGYLGLLKRPDGRVSTEISASFDEVNNKKDIPLIVPTLTKKELDIILSLDEQSDDFFDKLPRSIIEKAVAHANKRIKEGKPVFATKEEEPKKK